MTKKEFLAKLKRKLLKLPRKELTERVGFYNEIIDDKIEDGFSEEDAVADVGDVEQIAEQILKENGLDTSSVKQASGAQIALLIIGAPVWLPIMIAVYAIVWSLTITVWAIELPFLIMGFISKYLLPAAVASVKAAAYFSKKCFEGIAALFRR